MTVVIPTSNPSSWQPEPPLRGSNGPITDWMKVAEDLRQHPGQWRAVAAQAPSSTAAKLSTGQLTAFVLQPGEKGRFEAVVRDMDPKTRRGTVWAAYIIEGDAVDPEARADDVAEQVADAARYANRYE